VGAIGSNEHGNRGQALEVKRQKSKIKRGIILTLRPKAIRLWAMGHGFIGLTTNCTVPSPPALLPLRRARGALLGSFSLAGRARRFGGEGMRAVVHAINHDP